MSEDVDAVWIRTWDASYYEPQDKKWFYGQLKLGMNSLLFAVNKTQENSSSKPLTFCLNFSDVRCINKAMSSMIFPSIIAQTVNNESHWFSSFFDRNSSYTVINHFFQASLLATNSRNKPSSKLSSGKTELGTALLSSVYDSDVTLRKAASSLVHQGEKLAAISCTMQDIQEDLTVAERMTAGLNSWLGRWTKPTASKPGSLIFIKENDIPDVLDVEVLYTRVLSSRVGTQTCGVCRVESSGITILDMKQKVIHHFKWSEISRVRAVSPWEVMVTQYLIGEPDLSYTIVSVHTPSILSKITRCAASKVEYIEPSLSYSGRNEDSKVHEFSEPNPHQKSYKPEFNLSHQEKQYHHQSEVSSSNLKETIISDEEIDQLAVTLDSIKTTALGVKIEQDNQLENIDDLTSSVVKANDRVRAMNKTMDKLLK